MKSKLLKDLHKQLKDQAVASLAARARPAMPAPPQEPELSDEELFRQATRGATALPATPVPPAPPKVRKRPDAQTLMRRAAAEGVEERPDQPISDNEALLNPVSADEYLLFSRPGVQHAQMHKLRQGQLPWQATLDLHGCTVDQAREAVLDILHQARDAGVQILRVVHGKGRQGEAALLKTCVNGWLQQMPEVLGFCSCPPKDGGTGALYVLLKRSS